MTNPRDPEPNLKRLNRFLADAGLGSRRSVEDLVHAGRVAINGVVVTGLGVRIDPATDRVTVDGAVVRSRTTGRCYAFHKPHGVVSTLRAQGGQPSLGPYKRRADLPEPVMPIGRLDADSTGLLLWTDDGALARDLLRPGTGLWKTYRVTLRRRPTPAEARRFTGGDIVLDGRPCLACELEPGPGGVWTVRLHEGRKRQIRRMFRALDNRVVTLHRVGFGPIRLGNLAPGAFRLLDDDETAALRRAVRAKSGGQ